MKQVFAALTLILSVFFSGVANADITLEVDSLADAERRIEEAVALVETILDKPECQIGLMRHFKINVKKDEIKIPIVLVSQLFYGGVDAEGSLGVVDWDNDDMANSVCATLQHHNARLNYINVSLDTVLLADVNRLAFVLFHEILHYFQCRNRFPESEDASHQYIENSKIFEVCRP